jgi:hypothetical protein
MTLLKDDERPKPQVNHRIQPFPQVGRLGGDRIPPTGPLTVTHATVDRHAQQLHELALYQGVSGALGFEPQNGARSRWTSCLAALYQTRTADLTSDRDEFIPATM